VVVRSGIIQVGRWKFLLILRTISPADLAQAFFFPLDLLEPSCWRQRPSQTMHVEAIFVKTRPGTFLHYPCQEVRRHLSPGDADHSSQIRSSEKPDAGLKWSFFVRRQLLCGAANIALGPITSVPCN